MMTIKLVRVGRPLKIHSLLLSVVAFVLLFVSTCSTLWMQTEQRRMGIMWECFQRNQEEVCVQTACHASQSMPKGPFFVCMVLAITGLGLLFLAILLFLSAMLVLSLVAKRRLYNTKTVLLGLAALAYTACVIIQPVFFTLKFSETGKPPVDQEHGTTVTPGWALFLASAGVAVLILSIVSLMVDGSSD